MRDAKGKKRFTLIELVTVIAIAAIMMTLIGMAFQGLGSGNKVNQAAAEIGNALNWAKAQAASRRQYVAVIFVSNLTGADVPKSMVANSFAGYRLAIVDRPSGTTATFKNWVPNSDWVYLPKGTFLASIINKSAIVDDEFSSNFLDLPNQAYAAKDAANDTKARIEVADVEIRGNGVKMPAIVFSPKGVVFPNDDLYLVVGECVRLGGGDLQPPQNADQIQNSRQLKVNKFTGVISYE